MTAILNIFKNGYFFHSKVLKQLQLFEDINIQLLLFEDTNIKIYGCVKDDIGRHDVVQFQTGPPCIV